MVDWDEIFSRPGYRFGTDPTPLLVEEAARLKPGQRALCVAEGEGRNAVWLARQGLEVTAFDLSDVALEKARALAAREGVEVDFRQGDITSWDWQAQRYDVVTAALIQFVGPTLRDAIFRGMIAAATPGGLILLHGFSTDQMRLGGSAGPGVAENLYTEALLRDRFAVCEIARLSAYERDMHEGSAHDGRLALIDLVAIAPTP